MTDIERYTHDNERSALTERLLANARKSIREIAAITGLPEEAAAEKLSQLFEDRGWLTERQEERLLLIELGDLLTDAKARLKEADIGDYASIYRAIISNMNLMAQRFDARKKLVEADIDKITRANARLFGSAYDTATMEMGKALQKLHPEITDEEINDTRRDGLILAAKKLEKQVIN